MPLAEMEKRAILGTIELLHGDKLEAARLLGIGKTTLYRKLKNTAGSKFRVPAMPAWSCEENHDFTSDIEPSPP